MTKGLDANTNLTDHAEKIKAAGFDFVARYYKHTHSSLTRDEALALSKAGLSLVAVVEAGFPTSSAYFNVDQGVRDGALFYNYARRQIKQPAGAPIYFAVDFDPTLAEVKEFVLPYFHGVLTGFNGASDSKPIYPIGVYGSGLTCATVVKNSTATYSWLSMSKGWRQSRAYKGWNINQTTGAEVCGLSVDLDESQGHGGGFRVE